jgi:hypothetical protein
VQIRRYPRSCKLLFDFLVFSYQYPLLLCRIFNKILTSVGLESASWKLKIILFNLHTTVPLAAGWEGVEQRASQKTCHDHQQHSQSFRVKSMECKWLPSAGNLYFNFIFFSEGSFI